MKTKYIIMLLVFAFISLDNAIAQTAEYKKSLQKLAGRTPGWNKHRPNIGSKP